MKTKDDEELNRVSEEDFAKMSEFEKLVTEGRFLLEKKTKLKL